MDDMVLIADMEEYLPKSINLYQIEPEKINMKIDTEKTKRMILSTKEKQTDSTLKQFNSYNYLGPIIEKNGK